MTEHIAYCVAKWVNGKRQHWNKVISDVIKFPFVEEMYTLLLHIAEGGKRIKQRTTAITTSKANTALPS